MAGVIVSGHTLYFGGTFNPVHNGHVAMVDNALKLFPRVIVIPCRISPHKVGSGVCLPDGRHRMAMLRLAFAGHIAQGRVELDEFELQQDGPSFAWKTVEYLEHKYHQPAAILLGEDQYDVLHTWDKIDWWVGRVKFLVAPRKHPGGQPLKVEALHPDKICLPPIPEISSTAIRRELGEGRTSDGLPCSVADYIRREGLYPPVWCK